MAPDNIALDDRLFASEFKPMNVGSLGATRPRAAALGLSVLAVAFMETVNSVSADPQRGLSRTNPRPA